MAMAASISASACSIVVRVPTPASHERVRSTSRTYAEHPRGQCPPGGSVALKNGSRLQPTRPSSAGLARGTTTMRRMSPATIPWQRVIRGCVGLVVVADLATLLVMFLEQVAGVPNASCRVSARGHRARRQVRDRPKRCSARSVGSCSPTTCSRSPSIPSRWWTQANGSTSCCSWWSAWSSDSLPAGSVTGRRPPSSANARRVGSSR